ncbi:hypothetical protein RMSM_04042 [Rhodopirellula maiorica SM1]|uniref:Uncharacterized protein n=1 Tax=Rhodopirellula maiorica SM1 TaxID=1265738 RepID=M5RYL0_9BACT|nr:hypothetical protein RMSM_04042 [Rhodopirellula maiorica SM1]
MRLRLTVKRNVVYFRPNEVAFLAERRKPPGLNRTFYSPQPGGSRRTATIRFRSGTRQSSRCQMNFMAERRDHFRYEAS